MSGQTIRWAMAFVATATLSGSLVLSAAKAPAPAVAEAVARRDPASVGDLELELLLNKIREGDLLSAKKDEAGSRRAWSEARRMGEGLWPIHEGLADSYARAKRFEDALAEYKLSASLVPDKHASMRVAIGAKRAATLAAAGRPLEAVQAYLDLQQPAAFGAALYQLALDSDPTAAVALIERHAEVYDARLFKLAAGIHAKAERKAEAAEALGQFAMRVAPWDDAVNRTAVAGLRQAKKFDLALEVCRAWVRAVPESIEGYQLLGDVYWDQGKEREAIVAYSSIGDLRAGDAGALRRLGEIYLQRNLPDEAMAQFEKGLKLAPQDEALRSRVIPTRLAMLDRLKKEGKGEEARALRKSLAAMNVQEAGLFDLKVIMTWDAMSDVDLDVIEPDGVRINHSNRGSNQRATYSADNTQGHGPEHYTLLKAGPGTYRIGAHLHGSTKSTVKFVVILYEDTPREERREETIVLTQGGDTPVFIRDVIVR